MAATKAAQRAAVLAQLQGLSAPERESASAAIAARLRALPEWQSAGEGLALFLPFGAEPDCGPVPAAYPRLSKDGGIELARVENPTDPAAWTWAHMPHGKKMRQPLPDAPRVAPEAITLIAVPGVAFDRRGFRLGRGGGWYDRLLAQLPASALKVGLFFKCQELAEVATDGHDVPLDLVLTEHETLRCTDFRR